MSTMRRLKKGDVLTKRGGRRAMVVDVWYPPSGAGAERPEPRVLLEMLAASRKGQRMPVALGADGLPEGWRRSEVKHDWRGGLERQACGNVGCDARREMGGVGGDRRIRYRRNKDARAVLMCPPCEGTP